MPAARIGAGTAATIGALLALAGCHREPSFDERYASARGAIVSEAAAIDTELAARESEAAAADAALGIATPPAR